MKIKPLDAYEKDLQKHILTLKCLQDIEFSVFHQLSRDEYFRSKQEDFEARREFQRQ